MVTDFEAPLTPEQEQAWQLYCKETAGDMDVRDFWHELPPHVQQIFLDKVARTK